MARFRRTAIRTIAVAVVTLLTLALGLFALASPSSAQQAPGNGKGNGNGPPGCNPGRGKGDPYSCNTTTTRAPRPTPHLLITIHIGPPGTKITIEVCCIESGQPITITLGGITVLTDTAQPGVGAALGGTHASRPFAAVTPRALLQALGIGQGLRVKPAEGVFDSGIKDVFTVPNLSPGKYDICASTPGYPPGCDTFTVTAGGRVLGEQILADNNGSSRGAVTATHGGAVLGLARTGLELMLFLLLAVGFLVLGRFLVVASRRSTGRR